MTVGTLVTCVATVTATSPGAGTPTGQLKFLVDGTGVLPFGTLDATGHATFTSSTLAVGAHTIKAAYAGNANFLASSAQVTENVNPVQFASTTSLVCTPASVTSTQNVTCTATVRSPTGPGTPTGPVQFTNNGVNLGGTVSLSGGIARLVTTLSYGNHTIVAS